MLNMVDYSIPYANFRESLLTRQIVVVKNPLSPIEHPGGLGVNCELFEYALERFVVSSLKSCSVSMEYVIADIANFKTETLQN